MSERSNDKLDIIMKMIMESREEAQSEFKEINRKMDYLTEQSQIIKEQVVRNSEAFVEMEELKQDISMLEEQLTIVKKRIRN